MENLEQPQSVQPEVPMQAKSVLPMVIITAVITALVVGGATYVFVKDGDVADIVATETPSPSPIVGVSNYTNERLGFKLRLPNAWFGDDEQLSNYENADTFNLGTKPDDLESIFIHSEIASVKDLDDFKPRSSELSELVAFTKIYSSNGVEGRRVTIYSFDHPTGPHTSAYFIHNGIMIRFSLGLGSENIQDIFDQILSSLSF